MATNTCVLLEEDSSCLRCSICNQYLSVPPIKNSVDGTRYQCGRCNFDVDDITVLNLTFEKLAQYTRFPCIYEGCAGNLLWKDVEQHEKICAFRKMKCPVYDCEQMLGSSEMVPHFQALHKNLITSNRVSAIWQLDKPADYSLGMIIDNERPYICLTSQCADSFKISVHAFQNADNEKFNLTLFTRKVEILIQGESIHPYDDKKHCTGCLMKKCNSKSHKYSINYENEYKMTTEIEAERVSPVLRSDIVYCEVFIEKKNNGKLFDNSNLIRKSIECQICKTYMSPPIFNCETGHTICGSCKKNVPQCPTCRAIIKPSRNFTVEHLAENVTLPCENTEGGCEFIGTSKNLQIHEEICRFAEVNDHLVH